MKKLLAISTVKKALAKLGFREVSSSATSTLLLMQFIGACGRQNVAVSWNGGGNIIFQDGRWHDAGNVHIVSHFAFPRCLQDLEKLTQEVRRIYSTLCHCSFAN